ncbi:LPS biosynthesis-related glycosyltransferase [Dictyobacter vulcani]|uniref:LPS biosynthesis-related glycosyltransferase n=1 Tax=Dictyobacter vulcani TaxID=2607529 RepID=A0A5J4KSN7_9CHLR|nr:glycosyltransferase family 9 protein [Dictyobacter vulcani]GER90905.1 LPS biosynthesis-related glycosyltransferase [Dictyobacter vulcani]
MEYYDSLRDRQNATDVIPDVKKIAVLRADTLGDFIFILPALEALRRTYANAEIVLLGRGWHATFLENRPAPIDRVIVVPPYAGVSEETEFPENQNELKQFFAAMRAEHFDLAIQLHDGGRYANPFLLKLGAQTSAGLKTPDAVPLDRWLPYSALQHEIIRYQEVVSLVGVPKPVDSWPRLAVTQADLDASLAIVPAHQQFLVALHPGASEPRQRWPAAKFAAVGDALARLGARIVVIGTQTEKELTASVVQQMHMPAQDLAGQLSPGSLTGLLARCRLLVSNETGPQRVAGAIGTATVGIYWCLNMITAMPLSRLQQRPLVSWQLHCPACDHNVLYETCKHSDSLVASISTAEVITAARELISQI